MPYIRYWLWHWHRWRQIRGIKAFTAHTIILCELEDRPYPESIKVTIQ